jgi:hypothetical protein
LPKALKGSDDASNIVALTYREHFLAHWLLTKFTSGRAKVAMQYALFRMCHNPASPVLASWQYAIARQANVQACRNMSVDRRAAISARMKGDQRNKGRIHTPEARANIKAARQNPRPVSLETRAKIGAKSKGNQHRLGKSHSDAVKLRMSEQRKNPSAETRAKRSVSLTGDTNALGFKHGPEFSAAISERLRGNNYSLGYKHSAETLAKRGPASEATKAKMSAAQRERWARSRATAP